MLNDYSEGRDRKKAVIGLLYQMSFIDKDYDPREEKFINQVGQHIGLISEEISDVKENPTRFDFNPPPSEQERMNILYYVLFAMSVDGDIKEVEQQLCYKVALRLGFNEQMAGDLINVMKQYLNKEMPGDALLNAMKKYFN